MRATSWASCLLAILLLQTGCYVLRSSSGGGQTNFKPPRTINAANIALSAGFLIEPVATELTFPTAIAFDDSGNLHVLESGYSYGEIWTEPRLLKLTGAGFETVASGGKTGPWTGVVFHDGAFYITAGSVLDSGKILKVQPDGEIEIILVGIPSQGDHHVNAPVIGPDGALYFGIGTFTNSGVVGDDNREMGWLKRHPNLHDIPPIDLALSAQTFPPDPKSRSEKTTGGFAPFGTAFPDERTLSGEVLGSGTIIRLPLDGSPPEQFASGFRNPFGLAFSPDHQLYITENAYDDRGARPIWGAADHLWRVQKGAWYGWPDFSGGKPVTDPHFKPPGKPQPKFLLARHPQIPPEPVAMFGVHSSANGFDFSTSETFGHAGEAFVALFGDMAPSVAKVMGPVGFKVVRIDVKSGELHDFAVNKGTKNGPASLVGNGGFERPIDAQFSPDGNSLYVVDFGVLTLDEKEKVPYPKTGTIWRIWREEP